MANWLTTIDVVKEWNAVGDDETKIADLCKVVAEKLKALAPFKDSMIEEDKVELVDRFEDMAETGCTNFEIRLLLGRAL